MASGQAKHGKEKTEVRRERTGQVFHFFAMSSGEICAVKSYSLDSFLPEKQNCHPICCGISKLSVLCLCLVFFFPVLLFADHCRLCPSSPACHHCLLVPSPHSLLHPQSDPPWQSFTPAFLRFRSSQNIDKTQMVRSTAASDRASSRTPTHHGRSQLQLHTRGSWHGAGSVLGAPQKRCRGCSWFTPSLCSLPCSHIPRARLTRCFTWSQCASLLQPTVFLHLLLCCSHQRLLCCPL